MDTLPLELLHKIVKCIALPDTYKSRLDLKSLRQVNSPCYSVTTPFLFHTVALWMSLKSLENLDHIARHPHMRSHVHEIKISTIRVAKSHTVEGLEVIYRKMTEDHSIKGVRARLKRGKYVGGVIKHSAERVYLDKELRGLKMIARCAGKLRNLQTLEITKDNAWIGSKELYDTVGHMTGEEYESDHFYRVLILLDMIREKTRSKLQSLQISSECPHRSLPSSMAEKECQKEGIRPYPPLGLKIAKCQSADYKELESVLTGPHHPIPSENGLRIFKVHLPHLITSRIGAQINEAMTSIILNASTNLTSLSVMRRGKHSNTSFGRNNDTALFESLSMITLPRLRTLLLYGLTAPHAHQLISFLLRNCTNLEEVEIYKTKFKDYDDDISAWRDILQQVRKYNWTRLDLFWISDIVGIYDAVSAWPYVKRETDVHTLDEDYDSLI